MARKEDFKEVTALFKKVKDFGFKDIKVNKEIMADYKNLVEQVLTGSSASESDLTKSRFFLLDVCFEKLLQGMSQLSHKNNVNANSSATLLNELRKLTNKQFVTLAQNHS